MAAVNKFWLVFALPILLLCFVLGVYAVAQTHSLSLPTSDLALAISILTPVLSFLAFFLPDGSLRSTDPDSAISLPGPGAHETGTRNFGWVRSIRPMLNRMKALITLLAVVQLTLSASDLSRGNVLACALEQRWQELHHNRDERAVRGIQDAFSCCGFANPRDRAWPFQERDVPNTACLDRYAAHDPARNHECKSLLEARFSAVESMLTASAIGVLLIQLLIAYFTQATTSISLAQGRGNRYGSGRIVEDEDGSNGHQNRRYLDDAPVTASEPQESIHTQREEMNRRTTE